MTENITLTCSDCNTEFKITNDIERFACVNCEKEYVVKRGDGMVYLHQSKGENIDKIEVNHNSTILGSNFHEIKNKKIKIQELFALSDIMFSIGLIFMPKFSIQLFSDGIKFGDIIFFLTLFCPIFYLGWYSRKKEVAERNDRLESNK